MAVLPGRATEYFEQAIARDPTYGLAYAGLAGTYTSLAFYDYLPSGEAYRKAMAMVSKAIELDERSADAHALLGFISLEYEWNWGRSERELQRALVLDPNIATSHAWYGGILLSRGRYDDAIAEWRRAEALDPVSPIFPADLGAVLTFALRYDEAVEACKKALELEPDFALAHSNLAEIYRLSGRGDLAIAESRRLVALIGPLGQQNLAASFAAAGRNADAVRLLQPLIDAVRRSHSDRLVHLNVLPEFDAVRVDPRFQDLVRRIGIPSS